ncbi:hypothetical protein H9X80_01065 [Olsenella profusa]|uniref:Uncharacterized protein n=2 Tax=Olsenella profusa TaxID=138595 RepID=A0ABS2F0R1_9ACTN|nr:hypothetical protein [Olsenella profusa]
MDTIFSHITALEVFRCWDSFGLLTGQNLVAGPDVPARAPRKDLLAHIVSHVRRLEGATVPLHVLVSDRSARYFSDSLASHAALERYPASSFVRLGPGVACSAPELIALQMTEYATDIELLMLIDELCGHYGIQPLSKDGLVKRSKPLTSIERIRGFLDETGPVRGSRRLRRALDCARERSGSPQESRTCHRLEFCRTLGGYGVGVVGLNDPIAVSRAGSVLGEAATRIRKPDLMLLAPGGDRQAPTPFEAVALDYQGGYHRDEAQQARDIDRRNELLACNVKDYEIAKEHYDDMAYLDWLVSRIRADLGIEEPRLTERAQGLWQRRKADLNARLVRADGLHWTARRDPLVMNGARDYSGPVVSRGRILSAEAARPPG